MNESHSEAKELREISSVKLFSTPDAAFGTASSVSELCLYCGRSYYTRNTCQAKNAACFKKVRRIVNSGQNLRNRISVLRVCYVLYWSLSQRTFLKSVKESAVVIKQFSTSCDHS